MNQDNHLKVLAQELKAAAEKYTQATGKRFDADFEFLTLERIGFVGPTYVAGEVRVRVFDEARA